MYIIKRISETGFRTESGNVGTVQQYYTESGDWSENPDDGERYDRHSDALRIAGQFPKSRGTGYIVVRV